MIQSKMQERTFSFFIYHTFFLLKRILSLTEKFYIKITVHVLPVNHTMKLCILSTKMFYVAVLQFATVWCLDLYMDIGQLNPKMDKIG